MISHAACAGVYGGNEFTRNVDLVNHQCGMLYMLHTDNLGTLPSLVG